LTNNQVIDELKVILEERFGIRYGVNYDENKIAMTSLTWNMSAVMLYEFLLIIEDQYDVDFSYDDVQNRGFHNLDEISRLVCYYLSKNQNKV
jgi:hypothetical protein